MFRKLSGWFVGILFFILSASFASGQPLRVAVFIDQPSLSFIGTSALTLRSMSGQEVAYIRGIVQILPGTSGLLINGRKTGVRELFIDTKTMPLIVNGTAFPGSFLVKQNQGRLLGINQIDVEEYLKGVVPVEISPEWHPQVLKVQAIAARTYALYQQQINQDKEYDLVSTTADQVYTGVSQAHPAANQAVDDTRGLVLTYHGHLILSLYHSTSAGPTEDAYRILGVNLPYLRGVNCPFDRYSPRYRWVREIAFHSIEEAFIAAGYPIGMMATLTPFDWSPSGRVSRVRVLHSDGEIMIRGEDLRKILGYSELPSTQFKIEEIGRDVKFQGYGSGHGMGLCQWGAKVMAELGYSFDEILYYYYPGVKVVSYQKGEKGA